ncbi:winged helix-turn-helix transcriptional regulator [uncultured Brachyspira sp.]|uniref:winged helix-turn-helix transcriptional regulator n=1 Tax=uncultured Brachyspira sp. TaxID=221953 RepID=UPI0026294532|nr:winged helix-turn-helix transcriptional regulator [uncultured Brachyspira sp.]
MSDKKKVRKTSKDCYNTVVKDMKANLYRQILRAIRELKESSTCREIANHLKMEASTISARINELKKEGVLIEAGKRKCKITNIKSIVLSINKNIQWSLF